MLAACTGWRGDTADDCASSEGTISGVVYEDYTWDELEIAPAGFAKIYVQRGSEDPITVLTDDQGQYSMTLEADTWELDVYTSEETCLSMESYELKLRACQDRSLDLLIETCFL